jgi:hypothetical protein
MGARALFPSVDAGISERADPQKRKEQGGVIVSSAFETVATIPPLHARKTLTFRSE